MTKKKEAKAAKRGIKAAVKQGKLDKATAKKALAKVVEVGKKKPVEVPRTPEEQIWAAFAKVHGTCELCHGKDPFCSRLGIFTKPNGEKDYDPRFGGGEKYRTVEDARRLVRDQREKATMTPEIKQQLRERAAKKRAENGGPKRPPRVPGVYPQPGTLKAKAAEQYRAGAEAGVAADLLQGKVGTFRSWWKEFDQKIPRTQ